MKHSSLSLASTLTLSTSTWSKTPWTQCSPANQRSMTTSAPSLRSGYPVLLRWTESTSTRMRSRLQRFARKWKLRRLSFFLEASRSTQFRKNPKVKHQKVLLHRAAKGANVPTNSINALTRSITQRKVWSNASSKVTRREIASSGMKICDNLSIFTQI